MRRGGEDVTSAARCRPAAAAPAAGAERMVVARGQPALLGRPALPRPSESKSIRHEGQLAPCTLETRPGGPPAAPLACYSRSYAPLLSCS